MGPRKHISDRTKLASTLLALGDIPYDDAKQMTSAQIISLYHFDHGELHAFTGNDQFWNLTPRLILPHRAKSKIDTGIVAKARRIDSKWSSFMTNVAAGQKPIARPSRWPKRKLRT